jgi:uncharacterized protein
LARQPVVALLHAAEAASEGVKKLDSAVWRRRQAGAVAVIGILTSTQLDLALGRPNVIHAALLAGRASDTFLARFRRLERFRSDDLGDLGDLDAQGDDPEIATEQAASGRRRTELDRNG